MADVLVIDDDPAIARAFERFLHHDHHEYRLAGSAEEGLRLLGERVPQLVFMDVRMPGLDGLRALPMMRSKFPAAEVVIMTAHGSSQTSIDAIRAGAFDLLTKPLDVGELRQIIAKVTAAQAVRSKVASAGQVDATENSALVGDSPSMLEVFKLIGRLATLDVPALIEGERGTGKRMVVRTIHANSTRKDQPLTVIECAGLDAADGVRRLCEREIIGTVQLAGVEALGSREQARLAALLNEHTATPPARVLATTDANLGELVDRGDFNRELFEELGVITLALPPLRERRDDIPLLVEFLLRRLSHELGRSIQGVDADVERLLREHTWPGNIAELSNVLRRAGILTATGVITVGDFGDSLIARRQASRRSTDAQLARAAREALQERLAAGTDGSRSLYHEIVLVVEEALVAEALDITEGNQVKASDLLGVNRTTLRKKASAAD